MLSRVIAAIVRGSRVSGPGSRRRLAEHQGGDRRRGRRRRFLRARRRSRWSTSTTAGPTRTRTPTARRFATPCARPPKACRRIGWWRWAWAARSTASSHAMPSAHRCARRSSGWTNGPPTSATGWCRRWGPNVLAERTGLVADASHSAPKMMWIRDHEPQVWQRAAVLAPVGSYVLHHLSRLARPGRRERVVDDGVRRRQG